MTDLKKGELFILNIRTQFFNVKVKYATDLFK